MTLDNVRGRSAIVGAATAGVGKAPDVKTFMELAAEAALGALAVAGIALKEVDGIFGASMSRLMWPIDIAEYLGLHPRFCDGTQIGGSSFEAHCLSAALALEARLCDVALICFGATTRSGKGPWPRLREFDAHLDPYRAEGLHTYAMASQRHMFEFGTTRDQLSSVAVAARAWAAGNPEAFKREPLTLEAVAASRMIASPLTAADCCLVTDGAAALVMTRSDRARSDGAGAAYLLGAGLALDGTNPALRPALTTTVATKSGAAAYDMARLGPADMQCVQLYDAFTINVILFLEDLGFCAKGEGGTFAAGGAIAPGGALPVNTNGGGLACVHPGMYGAFMLVEAFQQLTGRAGARQLPSLSTVLCHGNGGNLSSQVTTIWGSAETL
ncbi:MAG TPA: acetyl-CoA acetyltransferase [Rhizomicrobium sp.]